MSTEIQGLTVGIVGSRTFTDEDMMTEAYLDMRPLGVTAIVSGGAAGADSLAAKLARTFGLELIEHLPDESRPSPQRFFERNTLIVEDADVILAFFGPDEPPSVNKSGTMDTVRKAIAKRIPVRLYFQD